MDLPHFQVSSLIVTCQESTNICSSLTFLVFSFFFFLSREERIWVLGCEARQQISQGLFSITWSPTGHDKMQIKITNLSSWYKPLSQSRCLSTWRHLIFILIRSTKEHLVPTLLPWPGLPSTGPGCTQFHSTWSWGITKIWLCVTNFNMFHNQMKKRRKKSLQIIWYLIISFCFIK